MRRLLSMLSLAAVLGLGAPLMACDQCHEHSEAAPTTVSESPAYEETMPVSYDSDGRLVPVEAEEHSCSDCDVCKKGCNTCDTCLDTSSDGNMGTDPMNWNEWGGN